MQNNGFRRSPRLAWVLATVLGAFLATGCNPRATAAPPLLDRPNIVLVTIDTLRADHLGCYGYFRDTSPHIDALARESLLFEQAYAAMATTLPSHTSILTARYPLEHGIMANLMHGGHPYGWKPGMVSFAQVAKEAGYATAAFVSSAPLKKQSGINTGFDTWSEPSGVERRAEKTLAEALPWLESSSSEPFFLWVHLFDPHWHHRAPAPYDKMFHELHDEAELEQWIAQRDIGDSAVRTNAIKTTETRKALNDYCGEVRYTDSQLGVLIERLRERGLLERSILVVTADHGEGLNQHDWAAHGHVWDEQLRVPLLVRFPASAQIAPRHVGALVSLVDLFPTLLARMRPLVTPLAEQFEALATGVDVLAPEFNERPVFGQRTEREMADDPGEIYAVTTRSWKYIHEPEVGDRLFDRRKDPHELENLLDREPQKAKLVHTLMEVMRQEQSARGEGLGEAQPGTLDPEIVEELKKLGYMGGNDARPPQRKR